jgi:hypothetical protein
LAAGGDDARRDAFGTLLRIARTGKLLAHTGGIRQPDDGPLRAVCFTAQPPVADHPLRHYDSARHRWLFGPQAVCIRRDALEPLGLEKALHCNEAEFAALPEQQRFRFQRYNPPQVDRTAEQEWRVPTDIDLKQLPREAVLFVTDTAEHAAVLRRVVPWRVCLADDLTGLLAWPRNDI